MSQQTRRILITLTIISKKVTMLIRCYVICNNLSNLNFRCLNINSVRNKFADFQEIINGNVDVISIAETKIDASFPSAQFVFE